MEIIHVLLHYRCVQNVSKIWALHEMTTSGEVLIANSKTNKKTKRANTVGHAQIV